MSFLAMIDDELLNEHTDRSREATCCNRVWSILWEFGEFLMSKHAGYEPPSDEENENHAVNGKPKEDEEDELYIDDNELYASYVASLEKERSTKRVYNLRKRTVKN
jgi:hypothetical protein